MLLKRIGNGFQIAINASHMPRDCCRRILYPNEGTIVEATKISRERGQSV